MRKGQITVFVILGIVIVAAVMVGFMMRKQVSQTVFRTEAPAAVGLQQEISEVNAFVDGCLENALREAVIATLNKGAVAPLTEKNSIESYGIRAPIYFADGSETKPTREDMEDVIKRYTTTIFLGCTSGFWEFEDAGFTVEDTGSISSELTLTSKDASIVVRYPIKLKNGDQSAKLDTFSAMVPIDALTPYNDAMGLYEKVKERASDEEIASFASEAPYTLGVEAEGNTRVYALKYDGYGDIPLVYPFAFRQEQKMPKPEEVSDETMRLFLTMPELFAVKTPPDSFDAPSIDDLMETDLKDSSGGIEL